MIAVAIVIAVLDLIFIYPCWEKAEFKGHDPLIGLIMAILFGGIFGYLILCFTPEYSLYVKSSTDDSFIQKFKKSTNNNINEDDNNQKIKTEQDENSNKPKKQFVLHKNCPYCGKSNKWEAETCANCGKPLE